MAHSLSFLSLRSCPCLPSHSPCCHVSQLVPEDPNTFQASEQPPPPTLIVDGKPESLIQQIIDSEYNHTRRQCQLLYHVNGLITPSPTTRRIGFWPALTGEAPHWRLSRLALSETGSRTSSEGLGKAKRLDSLAIKRYCQDLRFMHSPPHSPHPKSPPMLSISQGGTPMWCQQRGRYEKDFKSSLRTISPNPQPSCIVT